MSSIGSLSKAEVEIAFSKDRLHRLQTIYTVDDLALVLIHEQLNELSGAIFASVLIFEVHLRNLVSHQLLQMFGAGWYDVNVFSSKPSLKNAVKMTRDRAYRNAFSKLTSTDRRALRIGTAGTKKQRDKQASKKLIITDGDIISHFYFSFWRTLFSKSYEPQLWNFGLRKLFPQKTVKRGNVSEHLETIYKVRNRIAHHEFIHPSLCREYIKSVNFLTRNLSLKGFVRKGRMYKFQKPYVKRIEYQLSQLEHTLANVSR